MPQYFQSHSHKPYPIREKGDLGLNECRFIYNSYRANLNVIPFCSCYESPALCRRSVRPWAAQSKQLWALPSFLPCFTRGCRLEKYVGCCEQIRFMDLDCWGNHSRTENKLPGWSPCLNYARCWFISCPEYVIECLMDSLFISELTLLSIYIIIAEHMFSIDRESYFRLFTQRVGRFSLYEPLWKI